MLIRAFAILLAGFTSAILIWTGFEWIHIGVGLNPWIAFPVATILYFIPNILFIREAAEADCHIMDLMEHIEEYKRVFKPLPYKKIHPWNNNSTTDRENT